MSYDPSERRRSAAAAARGGGESGASYRPRSPLFKAVSWLVEALEPHPGRRRLARIDSLQPAGPQLRRAVLEALLVGLLGALAARLIGFEASWPDALGNGAVLAVIVAAVLVLRVGWRRRSPPSR